MQQGRSSTAGGRDPFLVHHYGTLEAAPGTAPSGGEGSGSAERLARAQDERMPVRTPSRGLGGLHAGVGVGIMPPMDMDAPTWLSLPARVGTAATDASRSSGPDPVYDRALMSRELPPSTPIGVLGARSVRGAAAQGETDGPESARSRSHVHGRPSDVLAPLLACDTVDRPWALVNRHVHLQEAVGDGRRYGVHLRPPSREASWARSGPTASEDLEAERSRLRAMAAGWGGQDASYTVAARGAHDISPRTSHAVRRPGEGDGGHAGDARKSLGGDSGAGRPNTRGTTTAASAARHRRFLRAGPAPVSKEEDDAATPVPVPYALEEDVALRRIPPRRGGTKSLTFGDGEGYAFAVPPAYMHSPATRGQASTSPKVRARR